MSDQLEGFLKRLARDVGADGEKFYNPAPGQDLDIFGADVDRLYRYEAEGLLDTSSPHREQRSGKRQIDSIKVRLTERGVKRWGDGQ
jgi:hypothetical protein